MLLVSSNTIINLYLALETASLTLYILAAGVQLSTPKSKIQIKPVENAERVNPASPFVGRGTLALEANNYSLDINNKGPSGTSPQGFAHKEPSFEHHQIKWEAAQSTIKRTIGNPEAGIKYFVFGTISTGLLLFGLTSIYGLTGNVNLDLIAVITPTIEGASKIYTIFILSALFIKLAIAPFH
eukprot:Colp12_sorted_trinity150504_noHs@14544